MFKTILLKYRLSIQQLHEEGRISCNLFETLADKFLFYLLSSNPCLVIVDIHANLLHGP